MSGRGLRIGGRIDRYVLTLYLASFATALFVVVGLFLVLDLAGSLDNHLETWKDGSTVPAIVIVRYYLLQLPFLFLQVGPFVTLVAGLFTVSKLLKHSETTAALATGVSAQRLLAPVVCASLCVGAGMFELREVLVERVAPKRDALRYVLTQQSYDQVYRHLFLKDLNGSFVHLAEFRPATGDPPYAEVRGLEATLNSVTHYVRVEADRAVFVRRGDGTGWRLEGGVKKEVGGSQPIEMLSGFDFTPELALTFHRAQQFSLELSWAETRDLARRDPDNVVYQTLLQYLITFPLGNVVLVLVGLPLLMRHERRRGAESLAAACGLCVLYFAADFVFRNLGMQAALEPKMAAWLPILCFGSLGIVLYDSMRT